jgi:hypothetical protein
MGPWCRHGGSGRLRRTRGARSGSSMRCASGPSWWASRRGCPVGRRCAVGSERHSGVGFGGSSILAGRRRRRSWGITVPGAQRCWRPGCRPIGHQHAVGVVVLAAGRGRLLRGPPPGPGGCSAAAEPQRPGGCSARLIKVDGGSGPCCGDGCDSRLRTELSDREFVGAARRCARAWHPGAPASALEFVSACGPSSTTRSSLSRRRAISANGPARAWSGAMRDRVAQPCQAVISRSIAHEENPQRRPHSRRGHVEPLFAEQILIAGEQRLDVLGLRPAAAGRGWSSRR